MISISNGLYKSIAIDWANITLPLNAGTPVSLAGAVSNDEDAIGIVPQTYKEVPLMPEIYVLIGGDVYRKEVEDTFGDDLEDAAISAMDGIRFYDEDGTPAGGGGSEGGGSEGSGGVLVCTITVDANVTKLGKTYAELKEALLAGQMIFGIEDESDDSEDAIYVFYLSSISNLQGYSAEFTNGGDTLTFTASTDTDELVYDELA